MIGSFYSGVSGLKSHLLWLDVIGENLANINSTGFKRSEVSFEDILNQNFKSAVAPRENVGGINPMQIGLGTKLASVQTIFTQGKFQSSESNTNLAIDGEKSFFMLDDGISSDYRYTRAGNFSFDSAGNLGNSSNGFKVLGWNAQRDPITNQLIKDSANRTIIDVTDSLTGVKIVKGDIMPGKATESLTFNGDLKSIQTLPVDSKELSVIKSIGSVVPVSKDRRGIDINKTWENAGFNATPDGTIVINGVTFKVGGEGGYETPSALMNAINVSAQAGVTIKYESDKFIITPDNTGVQVSLAESADTSGCGFFTQAFITAGTPTTPYIYNTSNKMEIQFEHILAPQHPDRNYYRWKAVDPTTTEFITTNAYYFERGDPLRGPNSIAPSNVVGKLIGMGDSVVTVFDLGDPDVDLTSLEVTITKPQGTAMVTMAGKRGMTAIMGYSRFHTAIYYFDDDGADARFGPSSNGVDRLVFCDAPPAGSKITVNYKRNGYNMHNSTVDPTRLQIKVNGEVQSGTMYKFRNNQGEKGNDEITFYSAVSSDEVVKDTVDVTKPFNKANFNWNAAIGSEIQHSMLSSKVIFRWTGGSWSSPMLSTFNSVEEFMSLVKTGTSNIVSISYDAKEDKFFMKNTQAISMVQTHSAGFLSLAKLKGEGFYSREGTTPSAGKSWVSLTANENPYSREEIVKNNLDLTQSFVKAGFNNEPPALSSIVAVQWEVRPGQWTSWVLDRSVGLKGNHNNQSGVTVQGFIDIFNDAYSLPAPLSPIPNQPVPLILRYDPQQDRFYLINTNRADCQVRIMQSNVNGWWTKIGILNPGLGWVNVPHSPIGPSDTVVADYYYNKTVEARGILQLDKDGKVIDNFVDTEASPVIYSSAKVLSGERTLNLSGGWDQFEGGTIDGTVKIISKNGMYISRNISTANYPTINDLIDDINASEAKVVITYHADTDTFSIRSREEGDEIVLEETGMNPFFSAINIAIGKKVGGNNNSVMDLDIEVPDPTDGWKETTGLFGTGNDFFKVNIMPSIVRGEEVGTAGKGNRGTQVIDEGDFYGTSGPITLNNADVDESTVIIKCLSSGEIVGRNSWTFLNGTGSGGRDQIRINTTMPNTYLVSYTRLNSFDLDNPDVDEATLVVKVDGRIIPKTDWVFEDNKGTNGVDRILLQSDAGLKFYYYDHDGIPITPSIKVTTNPGTLGSGKVTVDYRRVFPSAFDVFIPNGNEGPEPITFTPNISKTSYPSNAIPQLADSGAAITTKLKLPSEYQHTTSQDLYDAFGNPHKTNFNFERLSYNKWLWYVMNPVEKEKIAGYGILAFTGKGLLDKDNSQLFESPSDPLASGSRYKGIYFDPPSTPTPPEFGGAPPPEKGANASKILPDFNQVVQLSSNPSTVKIASQNGYAIGKLIEGETKIDSNGVVIAKYDNGQTQDVGQIALANFANPSGLVKLDATTFGETVNSGAASIGKPGLDGRGVIMPMQLEKSNVDLVQEFADMIVAQRAFQANSRTVTTADQMFIDIIAMKRL